jgi:hypothetical protein
VTAIRTGVFLAAWLLAASGSGEPSSVERYLLAGVAQLSVERSDDPEPLGIEQAWEDQTRAALADAGVEVVAAGPEVASALLRTEYVFVPDVPLYFVTCRISLRQDAQLVRAAVKFRPPTYARETRAHAGPSPTTAAYFVKQCMGGTEQLIADWRAANSD